MTAFWSQKDIFVYGFIEYTQAWVLLPLFQKSKLMNILSVQLSGCEEAKLRQFLYFLIS